MKKEKPRKVPMSQRNSIYWRGWNYKFKREHSSFYVTPMWMAEHKRITVAGGTLFCASLILSLTVSVLKIPCLLIAVALFTLTMIDAYKYDVRTINFYKDILDGGGEIADSFNRRLLGWKSVTKSRVTFIATHLIFLCVIIYFWFLNHLHHGEFLSYYWSVYLPFYSVYTFAFGKHTNNIGFAVIFMDFDKGVTIGNALFPYEKLEGFTPTGSGTGFEWYYEGKQVAWGTLLPDDIKYLCELMEIRNKYGYILNEISATAAPSIP